jgi:Tfp pilus assembly protein PilZ
LCKIGLADVTSKVSAVILDLSEAGARLLVAVHLEVGEEVVLGLEGPSYDGSLTCDGKVVWSFQATKRSYAVGVRFEEHLADEDIEEVTIPPVRLDY